MKCCGSFISTGPEQTRMHTYCMPFWNMCHLKHFSDWHSLPFWKMCISKAYVSDWHRVNFVISRGDNNVSLKTHCIWSSLTFITEKQTNAAWLYLWSLFTNCCASGSCILHAASIWRSLHSAVPIWSVFQKCTFFRMAHHANLKHVSGWHMFETARNTRTRSGIEK